MRNKMGFWIDVNERQPVEGGSYEILAEGGRYEHEDKEGLKYISMDCYYRTEVYPDIPHLPQKPGWDTHYKVLAWRIPPVSKEDPVVSIDVVTEGGEDKRRYFYVDISGVRGKLPVSEEFFAAAIAESGRRKVEREDLSD
jgi:hypothetical protein